MKKITKFIFRITMLNELSITYSTTLMRLERRKFKEKRFRRKKKNLMQPLQNMFFTVKNSIKIKKI